MAKTVTVEFSFFNEKDLPEGVAVGDVVDVARMYEIFLYFKEHFDLSVLSFGVEEGRITKLHIDSKDKRSVILDEQAVPTILAWAKALPEVRMFLFTADGNDGLYEASSKIKRSTLDQSLPHLLGILATEDEYGFVIAEELAFSGKHDVNLPLLLEADVDAAETCVTLNGKPMNALQLRGVNTPVNELDIPKWIKDYLISEGWIYIGDVLNREGMETILLEPSDGRDGMDPSAWKFALSKFNLSENDALDGWKRPESE